jgi:hypothetical protein
MHRLLVISPGGPPRRTRRQEAKSGGAASRRAQAEAELTRTEQQIHELAEARPQAERGLHPQVRV